MNHLDLFSGIGGFALAVDTVWPGSTHTFVENDPFCQAVLKKHWPQSEIYGDIRTFANTASDGRRESKAAPVEKGYAKEPGYNRLLAGRLERPYCLRPDILTGGFPCQPFSQAGRRKGTADDRHLWPEMLRVIRETTPRWVVAENVRGLLSIDGGLVFEGVCADLENAGYEVQPFVIPACAVNAPHRRDRVWIVAHATNRDDRGNAGEFPQADEQQTQERPEERTAEPGGADKLATPNASRSGTGMEKQSPGGQERNYSNPSKPTMVRQGNGTSDAERFDAGVGYQWPEDWPEVAARLCTVDDGLLTGLVRPRGWRNAALKAAGNAIVPQVAEQIMRAIKQAP